MRLALTTPTGNVGRRTVERLLGGEHDLVVLARDPGKLPESVRSRAEVVRGDLENPADVGRLVEGADALLYVLPPKWDVDDWRAWQRRLAGAAADAVRAAGVRRVVLLSSAGAQRDDVGPVSGVGEAERLFEAAAPDVASLRAGWFMENFFANLPQIAAEGALYAAFPEDRALAMVATRDIGDVAARWLADPSWTGHRKLGVHGPADLTFAQAAAEIGAGLGREVRYVRVPIEGVTGAMAGMGASRSVQQNYAELIGTFGAEDVAEEPRTAETTTPTTLRQFAADTLHPALASAG